MELADRIIYMQNGEIRREWTTADFLGLSQREVENLGLRPASLKQIYELHIEKSSGSGFYQLKQMDFAYKGEQQSLHIPAVNFTKGTAIAVIGKNGAGKSTFLRCLCGLEKRCSGEVQDNGKSYSLRKWAKNCYLVMQDVNHQLFSDSVKNECLSVNPNATNQEIENLLNSFDLLDCIDRHPLTLSGGQRQRLAICQAIMAKKKFLIFDEPTSGLDFRHI